MKASFFHLFAFTLLFLPAQGWQQLKVTKIGSCKGKDCKRAGSLRVPSMLQNITCTLGVEESFIFDQVACQGE